METKKPWEAGYVAPAPGEVMSKSEAGRLGNLTAFKRRAAGLPKIVKGTKPGRVPDPTSAASQKAEWETEDNISDRRREFLNKFVLEYLHDFNAPMAYIRAGGAPSHATTGGHEAKRSAYAQAQIKRVIDCMEEEDLLTRKDVLLGLKKEANYHGEDSSQSARVRAWAQLGKIKGMEVQKVDTTVTHKGGIMLVPMAPSLNSWEEAATDAQAMLKHEVRK